MAQEKKERIFPDGFFLEKKENSPDWIIGSLSIKVRDAVAFLQMHEKKSGYVNIDVKESLAGKLYCELDTWVPKEAPVVKKEEEIHVEIPVEYPEGDSVEDIPF